MLISLSPPLIPNFFIMKKLSDTMINFLSLKAVALHVCDAVL